MSVDSNRDVAIRYVDEVIGGGNLALIDELVHPEGHDLSGPWPMIDVYRKYHEPYGALIERIEPTDRLIDYIVYRLYGLTEEEIAVVEGRTTASD